MSQKEPDPVDLMLDGKLDEAADKFLQLYMEALEAGDFSVGRDLVAQLHYCLAGAKDITLARQPPEQLTHEVGEAIFGELKRRGVDVDRHRGVINDDLAIAKEDVQSQRKRAEKSIEAVEKEKQRRWEGG